MNIAETKQLGEVVRRNRKRLKVTQKDLALAAGTGLRFISDLENGKPTCHVGRVLDTLRALGLHVEVEEP